MLEKSAQNTPQLPKLDKNVKYESPNIKLSYNSYNKEVPDTSLNKRNQPIFPLQ